MSPPRAESLPVGFRRIRVVRWLLPAALLALTPKCVLCVLAYVGAGTALGLGGPEWCGATGGSLHLWPTTLLGLAVAGVCGVSVFFARRRL